MKDFLEKLDKTRLISLVTFSGFLTAVIYHFVLMEDRGYPYNTFLFRPWDRFNDFFMTIKNGNSPYITGEAGSLFPLGHRIVTVFNLLSPTVALMIFLIGFAFLFTWFTYKNVHINDKTTKWVNVLVLAVLSYPFLFVMDRGNVEALLFAFLYGFIWWYNRNPKLSVLCLVIAIGMKVFPAIFLILLLSDKKYKEVITAVVTVIGLSILSLLTFNGDLSEQIYWLFSLLETYNEIYVYNFEGILFGHSLWGIIGTFMIGATRSSIEFATNCYLGFVGIYFAGISYYIIFIEKEFWKRVALLVFTMNLLPYVSGDYKLLHLFLPLFLFLNTGATEKMDKVYAMLFGLLLIPKSYYHFSHLPTTYGLEANSAIFLNSIIMLIFTIVIVMQGMRKRSVTR